MPSFNSSRMRAFGGFAPNSARWMSSEVKRPARRTTIRSPSSSHSRTEPGPMPSLRRTSIGTEICPWDVSFERASGMIYLTRVMRPIRSADQEVHGTLTAPVFLPLGGVLFAEAGGEADAGLGGFADGRVHDDHVDAAGAHKTYGL